MNTPSLLVLLVTVAFAAADIAHFSPCRNEVNQNQCTVSEVRINPCNSRKDVCQIKRGRDANLNFDFTPNFAATKVKTAVYYLDGMTEVTELSAGFSDACILASSPLTAGAKNVCNYDVHVERKLPPGQFPLRWKVWNAANESQICCFETTVKLV